MQLVVTTNPFLKIIAEFNDQPKTLTVGLLTRCQEYLELANQTYTLDEVFKILQYLETAKILVIAKNNYNDSFTIKLT